MRLRDTARAALAAVTTDDLERAAIALNEGAAASITARLEVDDDVFTVVWETDANGARLACTCGDEECVHRVALLLLIAGEGDELVSAPEPEDAPPPSPTAPSLAPPSASPAQLAAAIRELVRKTCEAGIAKPSSARDDALHAVVEALTGADLPDLRRAVATLRRTITSPEPDPSLALPVLARLSGQLAALDAGELTDRPLSKSIALSRGATRREEVRLLEVARRTQRTPFGDRREVSFFLDLDERILLQELGTTQPGTTASYLSDGPFPKRLLGNLIAVEDGPSPQRVRLLQYASAGFASESDLEAVLASCATSIPELYAAYREAVESHLDPADHLVLYAPDHVWGSRSGVVLADHDGTVLPLARGVDPPLCETVDLLVRQGTLLAVAGQLVATGRFLSLMPLSALLRIESRRTLRRLT